MSFSWCLLGLADHFRTINITAIVFLKYSINLSFRYHNQPIQLWSSSPGFNCHIDFNWNVINPLGTNPTKWSNIRKIKCYYLKGKKNSNICNLIYDVKVNSNHGIRLKTIVSLFGLPLFLCHAKVDLNYCIWVKNNGQRFRSWKL